MDKQVLALTVGFTLLGLMAQYASLASKLSVGLSNLCQSVALSDLKRVFWS